MTATKVTRRRALRSLAIAIATVVSLSISAVWGGEPTRRLSRRSRKFEALIDALANRSVRPRIVNLGIEDVPIFDESYNWKEQARVLDAIEEVWKHAGPEMWELLLAHEKDGRYLLTFADEAENGFAFNWTIGDLCREIAYAQLVFPVKRNLEILEKARKRMPDDLGRVDRVNLPSPFIDDLPKWRESRAGKTFSELQIEMCERAIGNLPGLEDVPEKAKAEFRARIELEIAQLKKSKQGLFRGFGKFRFPGERYDLFNEDGARRIRQEYAKWKEEPTNRPGKK